MIDLSRNADERQADARPCPDLAGLCFAVSSRMRNALLVLVLTAACSGGDKDVLAARELPAAVKEDATAIAKANNQFAFDLYGELAAEPGNLFLSPFSISTALAMVDAGAAGTTDAELRAAMHFNLAGERLHGAYRALLASLDTGRGYGAYTLAVANRLFGQTGASFVPAFLTITRRDYSAELMPVDFLADPEAARTTVNSWVADHTDRLIPELFGAGTIDSMTRLVLANAIAFKGSWENHFDQARSVSSAFKRADSTTVQATMMHKLDSIATASIPGGRLGLLPFHGKDLSMVVVLPELPGGLPAIEAQLTGDAIAQWIASAHATPQRFDVSLPRFGITSKFDLPEVLQKLGVISAFDSNVADLSGIDGTRELYVQRVVHKATITVDENGAEAAAATGVGVGPASEPLPFVADRPFVFMIYDHVTGSILFLGRIEDPSA
jgi:serpin B